MVAYTAKMLVSMQDRIAAVFDKGSHGTVGHSNTYRIVLTPGMIAGIGQVIPVLML